MNLSKINTSFPLKDKKYKDLPLNITLIFFALITSAIVVFIIFFLFFESTPFIKTLGLTRLFTDEAWYPTDGLYALLPMLIGSFLSMLGAVLIATPVGIISAIFMTFYAPFFIQKSLHRILSLLSGVPSVVFGLWGLVTLVPILQKMQPPGTSLLAGILILTLMILPTTALISYSSLKNLPQSYFLASSSLALSQFTTIMKVALPAAKPGILTAIILSSGRAIGETMAILMVCGNIVQMPTSILSPIRTLTTNIALEMGYAVDHHRSALFVSSFILMLFVTFLVLITKRIQNARL